MFRALKKFCLVLSLLLLGGHSLFAFALLGPFNEAYQINTIGFNLAPGQGNDRPDTGAPKNIGEGYRWNTKNVYYSYDATFLDYFGAQGAAAIDAAFAMVNNLSNVDSYSPGLGEWPLNSSRVNYAAEALGLLDLKSVVMSVILEELGLAQPDRWTYCLHDRFLPAGALCPNFEYAVIQRNFDPVTQLYSSYVNGTLYGYKILEECNNPNNPFAPLLADAVEVDLNTGPAYTAVAAGASFSAFTSFGIFYTGFTRDDIGGLRYGWTSNRLNVEAIQTNNLLVLTNQVPTFIVTSNLATLDSSAFTNNPAALQALFPTLQITSSTFLGVSNVVTTNIITFLTNSPFAPAGAPPTTVTTTVVTTNLLPIYSYTFGNVITNFVYSQGFVTVQTVTVGNAAFGPPGTLTTNTSSTTSLSNFVNGEYFIIPANQCGFSVISTNLPTVVTFTNTISVTNSTGTVNGTLNYITYFTNHTLIVSIPTCASNVVELREGMEKINFFRQDFDSLLGQAWGPVTNTYTLTAVTNSMPVTQTIYRVVTAPDILFSAADLLTGPAALLVDQSFGRTTPNWNQANNLPGLAGPGTIAPPVQLVFNKVGPVFVNEGSSFQSGSVGSGSTSNFTALWGSFDGTTNAPIVYPNGTSLAALENNVFLQITVSGPLPNGNRNQFYSTQLSATGAQPPPYTWSLAAKSPALPPGLNISSGTGVISGTPTATGIFDFTIQVADTAGRNSSRNFTIEIDP